MELEQGTITLYPTRVIIDNYKKSNKLESPLSVWNKVTYSYDFQAFILDVDDNGNDRIYLPTTYNVNYLLQQFPNYEIVDKRLECEKIMKNLKGRYPIKMKYDFRDDIQKGAYNFLNKKNKHGYRYMQRFLCLLMGKGKTYVSVRYIADNNERPIIFVDQDTLGKQWVERIKEYTDTTDDEIYYISGQPSINKLMNMTDDEIYKIKFFLCCYRTLTNNLRNTHSAENISKLFNKIKVSIKIFDEAHIEYKSIFAIDMIYNVRSIYLTATPKRADPIEDKVYQNIFQKVERFFEYLITGETEEPYHNIIIYNWNSNPALKDQMNCATKYGFSMPRYCRYLIQDSVYDKFEELIYNVVFNFVLKNRKKKKLAILFGTNELLDKFYNNLLQYVKDNNFKLTIGKFNGTIKKDERLKALDSDIIITTDKSFGKGMDVKDIQVMINTVPFSADTKLTQTVGRLRPLSNKEVFFIDINDLGFDAIKNQSRSKKKVYEKLAKNIILKNYQEEISNGS